MNLNQTIQTIATKLQTKKLKLVTAESCTGGLVAKYLTDLSGSSQWFERGYVTYSNEAKQESLNVSAQILEQFGAVSEETVRAMAEGALKNSHAQISLAITGIAGPNGGTTEKPVGTVWFAWSGKNLSTISQLQHFHGSRSEIREQAADFVLKQLLIYLA